MRPRPSPSSLRVALNSIGASAVPPLQEQLPASTVQHRLRHGSATTTLNTYSHLWPDRDEQTRAAVGAVLRAGPSTKINDAESRLGA